MKTLLLYAALVGMAGCGQKESPRSYGSLDVLDADGKKLATICLGFTGSKCDEAYTNATKAWQRAWSLVENGIGSVKVHAGAYFLLNKP